MTTFDLVKKYGVQDVFFGAPKTHVHGLLSGGLPAGLGVGVALMLVAFVVTLLCAGGAGWGAAAGALAVLPLMPARRCLDADAGGGGGGAMKTLDDVKDAVIKKIDERDKKFTDHMASVDNWQKETKAALEDLTKLKNQQGATEQTLLSMKKLIGALGNERRAAFGNPAQRIAADPELRAQFNIMVRQAGAGGEFAAQVDALKKALNTSDTPGSTLINPQLYREIYELLLTYGAWPTLKVVNLGTKVTSFPVKTARPQFSFVDEGGALPEVSKQGASKTMTPEIYGGILTTSLALLQDAEFDLTADILADFGQASAELLDYMAFVSTGAADARNKGFTGIFNSGAASVGSAQAIEELKYTDFLNAFLGLNAAAQQRPCRWWAHPTMIVRALGVKDNNGRPIFLTALEAPSNGAIGSILGYPVTPVAVAPSANEAGAPTFAIGNPDGAIVGVRSDFNIDASDEYRFSTLERAFRGWGRGGFMVRSADAFSVLTLAS